MKVEPHEIANVEDHGLLVDVELGRKSWYLSLDGMPSIFMHLLEMIQTCTCVQIDALLEW